MKNNRFMTALALACALALAACSNPAGSGTEAETPRGTQFTIAFDSGEGTEVQPVTDDEGGKIDKPEDPAREGYIFLGWFTEPEGGALFTAWPHSLAGDLTLYAHWRSEEDTEIDQYTIDFESYGGSDVESITADKGTNVQKPGDPERAGYVFINWYSEEVGGELYSWPYTLAGDVTMHAQWRAEGTAAPKQYTLTFRSQGGSIVPAVKADSGTNIQQPAEPTRSGYTFLGWYNKASDGTQYEWPVTLTRNTTVYAQWQVSGGDGPVIENYTITFDSQGGSETSAANGDAGTQIEKPAKPSLEGYIFQGWYSEAEGGTEYEWPHTLSGDVTMYARWSGISYTVEYDGNGGTGSTASTSHVYGTESPLAGNGFTWSDHSFEGWNTQADGLGLNYSAEQPITDLTSEAGGKVTLYARWIDTTVPQYTISFDSNGGNAINSMTVNAGASVGHPLVPTRNGYTFLGWHSAVSGGTKYEWPRKVNEDLTLHAQWALTSYTITYNPNGGENAPQNPVSYNIESQAITLAAPPSREYYTFEGWYAYANLSGDKVTVIYTGATGNKTFWAKWKPISYTITYNLNDGLNAANPGAYTIESAGITLASPSRENYAFGGWYINADLSGGAVASIPAGSTGNRTFWAKWTSVTYTITYNLNGGSLPEDAVQSYAFGDGVTLPVPGKANNSFAGLYDNAAFTGEALTSIPAGSVGNKTFWAKWAYYTVVYDENHGSGNMAAETKPLGEPHILSANGYTRPGYIFGGWSPWPDGTGGVYPAGKEINPILDVNGAVIRLYAYWMPANFTINLSDTTRGGNDESRDPESYTGSWQFYPERKEFVIRAGNQTTKGQVIYVTGSTTEYRIRVMADVWNNRNKWGIYAPNLHVDGNNGYIATRAYSHGGWGNWKMNEALGYGETIIEGTRRLPFAGGVYPVHNNYVTIVFVNASIDLSNAPGTSTRSPVDIGPYHGDWANPSQVWEGDYYASERGDVKAGAYTAWNGEEGYGMVTYRLNDHEVHATLKFEGQNTLRGAPGSKGITVWDSANRGNQYMYELPLEPDSDSLDSFKTDHNKPYWEEFRHNVHAFIWRWGVYYSHLDSKDKAIPYLARPEILAMGWGRSSLNVEFGSGASLAASNTGGTSTETLRTNSSPTDGNNWLHWDHRGAIFTAITGSWYWPEPSISYPGKGNGPVYW